MDQKRIGVWWNLETFIHDACLQNPTLSRRCFTHQIVREVGEYLLGHQMTNNRGQLNCGQKIIGGIRRAQRQQ